MVIKYGRRWADDSGSWREKEEKREEERKCRGKRKREMSESRISTWQIQRGGGKKRKEEKKRKKEKDKIKE